jgi:mRNA interferase YafQ
MREVIWHTVFKKEFKLAEKRGKNMKKLADIIDELSLGKTLPPKNKNHKLKGNYIGCWECHIEPNWLLIYQISPEELILMRTGSHSDLF